MLRSSLREFLCSEAMHHLGVPTTRALSLVATGEPVVRDMFYDGHPRDEPGAVVCRVAPSFMRFGNFEIHAARDDHDTLRRLVDFTIARYYPGIDRGDVAELVRTRSCSARRGMVADWMRVGFVHGVMNTDNMSILGLTIDYGPYGWLEPFDLDWTPNTTDASGRRYRFGNQPRSRTGTSRSSRARSHRSPMISTRCSASVDAFPARVRGAVSPHDAAQARALRPRATPRSTTTCC